MNDQRIPVESLDPDDEEAVRRWAVQLDVTVAKLVLHAEMGARNPPGPAGWRAVHEGALSISVR